jgi:uncharacterized membrane protein
VIGTTFAALLFFAGTYAAPVLSARGAALGSWLRAFYAPLCHQIPERSIEVAGGTQAVCARCAGLYAGGILGLVVAAALLVPRGRSIRARWLAIALAPTVVDALLPWIGLPALPNLPRLLLAVPAGLAAGLFLGVGVADLAGSLARPAMRGSLAVEESDG